MGRAVALFIGLSVASLAPSEKARAQTEGVDWVFSLSPFAELWFHGMAMVDPVGRGPMPLYNPAYPNVVRKAKSEAGLSSTALDSSLGYFRQAFRGDPSFEILHFLPAYFPTAGRTEVFTALEALSATRGGIPESPSPRTAFGLTAVGSVLATPEQRMVLGEFARALRSEWAEFFGGWWQGRAAERDALYDAAKSAWREDYRGSLADVLDKVALLGGTVTLVPALGAEGRIFSGTPQGPVDNVLMVSAPEGPGKGHEVVFSMLRELSFPLVRTALGRLGEGGGTSDEEESRAARAAIRSGALILEMYCPDHVTDYQQFFLSRAGRLASGGDPVESLFNETFPMDGTLERLLREEISTTATYGGAG